VLTHPETRTDPSRFERAAIGSGSLRYAEIFSAGFASGSFQRDGGPLAPQEEMKSLVEEVDGLGVVKKAEEAVAKLVMARRLSFMMEVPIRLNV